MNKKVLIGVGILAVAGVAFYLWKKNQKISKSDNKSNFRGIRQKSHRNSSATGTTGEVISNLNLEKSKNYRDDIKEIEPINYSQVNKGFYYGGDGRVKDFTKTDTNKVIKDDSWNLPQY